MSKCHENNVESLTEQSRAPLTMLPIVEGYVYALSSRAAAMGVQKRVIHPCYPRWHCRLGIGHLVVGKDRKSAAQTWQITPRFGESSGRREEGKGSGVYSSSACLLLLSRFSIVIGDNDEINRQALAHQKKLYVRTTVMVLPPRTDFCLPPSCGLHIFTPHLNESRGSH